MRRSTTASSGESSRRQRHRLVGVAGGAHVVAALAQGAREPLAEHLVVVDQQQRRGRALARTVTARRLPLAAPSTSVAARPPRPGPAGTSARGAVPRPRSIAARARRRAARPRPGTGTDRGPVPWPGALVVKNGSPARASTSGCMPAPSSRPRRCRPLSVRKAAAVHRAAARRRRPGRCAPATRSAWARARGGTDSGAPAAAPARTPPAALGDAVERLAHQLLERRRRHAPRPRSRRRGPTSARGCARQRSTCSSHEPHVLDQVVARAACGELELQLAGHHGDGRQRRRQLVRRAAGQRRQRRQPLLARRQPRGLAQLGLAPAASARSTRTCEVDDEGRGHAEGDPHAPQVQRMCRSWVRGGQRQRPWLDEQRAEQASDSADQRPGPAARPAPPPRARCGRGRGS